MFNGTLTLLDRTLRQNTLLMPSHLYRIGFVALVYLCLANYGFRASYGAPGLAYFEWMSGLNFLCISAAGIVLFTTAIGEEKEEAMLELLKLAGINRISLLLGKSTGQLLAALVILSLQIPFTMLAITLGGVTTRQILAMYFSLAAYLVAVANVGLFFSVICRRVATAGVLTTLFLAMTTVLPSIVLKTFPVTTGGNTSAIYGTLETMKEASIIGRMEVILETDFMDGPVGLQVGCNLAVGALLFLISWGLLERFMGNRNPLTILGQRGRRHSRTVWTRAIMWKDFTFIAGGWRGIVSKSCLYALIVAGIRLGLKPLLGITQPRDLANFMIGVMTVLVVIELTFYSSRVFHDEIRDRTLSSLRLLPMSIGTLSRRKVAGCLLGLLPAIAALLIGCTITPHGWTIFGPLLISPGVWCAVLSVFYILHFAMLMSLTIRWWWLTVAMVCGMLIPASPLLWGMVSASGWEQMVCIVPVVLLAATIHGLHRGIESSLEKAAAD